MLSSVCCFCFHNLVVAMSNNARTSTNYWYDKKEKSGVSLSLLIKLVGLFFVWSLIVFMADFLSPLKNSTITWKVRQVLTNLHPI